MKVLQINSVCGVGSTGRITTDLYKVLEEHGHECVIAYGRGTAPNGIKTIKIGTEFDNYMHVVKTRIFDKHGFGSTKATKEFIEKVKKYNPDVIHLHNIHGYYINIEVLFDYLKEANKKVIWTLHDCWSFTGHCSHFNYIGCNNWKSGCVNCKQKKEYPSSILKDNSTWNYERKKEIFTKINGLTIVTPSKWLCDLVDKSFLNKYSIKVINNGIDLNIFKATESSFREKYNLQNKKIILGVANIWSERKGLNYFIELSKVVDEEFKIVMVGVTDKQKKKLPKEILAIKKTDSVEELAEIYSASDIFFNPTLEDTFPTVNIEAIASGTPVILFKGSGGNEMIDKKCGIILEEKSIENVVLAINSLINNNLSQFCFEKSKIYNKVYKYLEYINLLKEN